MKTDQLFEKFHICKSRRMENTQLFAVCNDGRKEETFKMAKE